MLLLLVSLLGADGPRNCNTVSRPWVFVMALVSYVMGFAIIMKSPTLAAYIVGNVFVSIGAAGLGFLTSVLTADLVPLKWRGFAQ